MCVIVVYTNSTFYPEIMYWDHALGSRAEKQIQFPNQITSPHHVTVNCQAQALDEGASKAATDEAGKNQDKISIDDFDLLQVQNHNTLCVGVIGNLSPTWTSMKGPVNLRSAFVGVGNLLTGPWTRRVRKSDARTSKAKRRFAPCTSGRTATTVCCENDQKKTHDMARTTECCD